MLKKDEKKEWDRLDKWLRQFTDIEEIIALGGNIRAFLSAYKLKKMKSDDFLKKYKHLRNLEIDEKINKFGSKSNTVFQKK